MRPSTGTTTVLEQEEAEQGTEEVEEQLVLRLRAPPSPPHVTWAADVIDNEHMGRLKSNCCCIYVAPRKWDDPSTWEPDEHETEHCRGHTLPEKKSPVPEKEKDGDKENGLKEDGESHHGCGCDHC